jgi:hypothetical protein
MSRNNIASTVTVVVAVAATIAFFCIIVFVGFKYLDALADHNSQTSIIETQAILDCAMYALEQSWELNRGIIDSENMYVCKVQVNGTWYSNIIPTGNINVWAD